jgi:hypothetical protein
MLSSPLVYHFFPLSRSELEHVSRYKDISYASVSRGNKVLLPTTRVVVVISSLRCFDSPLIMYLPSLTAKNFGELSVLVPGRLPTSLIQLAARYSATHAHAPSA